MDQRVYHEGLAVAVRQCLGVFYADDGMVGSRDNYWIQHSMNVMVGLFWRYGHAANVAKSRSMTYQPNTLRSGMSV